MFGDAVPAAKGRNLFTPGFGTPPYRLVGREDEIGEIEGGLRSGPADPRFASLLLGPRGSGKTVILNELESTVASKGWAVLSADTSAPGIYARMERAIRKYATTSEDSPEGLLPPDRESETEVSVSVKVASISRRSKRRTTPLPNIEESLEIMGLHAQSRGSAVLVTVDEIHSGDVEELRSFASDMQRLIKRRLLPIAFVGAGLPNVRNLFQREKITFFLRCHDEPIGSLNQSSVLSFLSNTLTDAGREYTADAVMEMASASGGYPYKMQLIGDEAWKISGSRSKVVDSVIADLAIREASNKLRQRVHESLWHDLPRSDQAILKAVAQHGGLVARRTLGASLPLESSHVTHRIKELVDIGCLVRDGRGPIRLGPLASMHLIEDIMSDEKESALATTAEHAAEHTPMPEPNR